VTRILDDWPSRHQNDPVLIRRFYWQIYLHKIFKNLIKNAAINVGISKEMCDAFQGRYQAKFVTFHNCVDFTSWHPEKQYYTNQGIFNIIYMGSINVDKELQSLIDIKEVILQLNRQQKRVHLTIYGPEKYAQTAFDYLEAHPIINYGGYFRSEDKFKILKDADLLCLPINFDLSSITYLGYSFQTKVPEYMASGTPVLIYGPTENPNVKYAKNYQWAAIVDQRDRKLLMSTINELIANPDRRKYLGQNARKLALQNHDAGTIRPAFQKMLRDIVVHKKAH